MRRAQNALGDVPRVALDRRRSDVPKHSQPVASCRPLTGRNPRWVVVRPQAEWVSWPVRGRSSRAATLAHAWYADERVFQPTTSGLPLPIFPIGGAADVAFLDDTAYVLVTMVGADLGGSDTVGVYRVDGPTTSTVVADIGAFSLANPPDTDFFIPTGVHYSIEAFRGGFLVTDGHHNRILQVSLDGDVTEVVTLGNVVPTGNDVYFTLAGPVPHEPEQGRVMATDGKWSAPTQIASGAPLAVDVELGRGRTMYALAQGDWPEGSNEGDPALPDTGELLRVNDDGSMTPVVAGLDRPTSMEVAGTTAWVVSLDGEITRVDNLAGPPFGR